MELKIGSSPELIAAGQKVRHQVFVVEQGIDATNDLDGKDGDATLVVIFEQGKAIATARLTINLNKMAVMSRIAVLPEHRGKKLAERMIGELIHHAELANITTVKIHAHHYLRRFYETLGFVYQADAGRVAAHKLIEMCYALPKHGNNSPQ